MEGLPIHDTRVETEMGFRTGGKVVERLVEIGDVVKAGQALARLDPADYQLAVSAAADQVQARPAFAAGLGQRQRPAGKIKCGQTDLSCRLRPDGLPVQTARDHQVKH